MQNISSWQKAAKLTGDAVSYLSLELKARNLAVSNKLTTYIKNKIRNNWLN